MTAPTPRPLLRILGIGFGLAIGFGSTIRAGVLQLPRTVAAAPGVGTRPRCSWLYAGVAVTLLAACSQSTPEAGDASRAKAPTRATVDAPVVNFATFVGEIVQIPRHVGPRFHVMPGQDSTACRAGVPR